LTGPPTLHYVNPVLGRGRRRRKEGGRRRRRRGEGGRRRRTADSSCLSANLKNMYI